jgi:hypothetical protein
MLTLLLAAFLVITAGAANAQDVSCENEQGEFYTLPLAEYRAGLRPYGPCYAPGTSPGGQAAKSQAERSLRQIPGLASAFRCRDCIVDAVGCKDIANIRCWQYPWAQSICDICRTKEWQCAPARRIGCPDLAQRKRK